MHFKNSIVIAALLVATLAGCQTGAKSGYHNVTAQAKCSPGDPYVVVDLRTKTYVMDTSSIFTEAATSGVAAGTNGWHVGKASMFTEADTSGVAAGTNGWPVYDGGAVSKVGSMCRSQAESMGAHMASGTGTQK